MDMETLLGSMTPEIYQNLLTAVDHGHWEDGNLLSLEQLQHAKQLLMQYQALHNPQQDQYCLGEDDELLLKPKQALQQQVHEQQIMLMGQADAND